MVAAKEGYQGILTLHNGRLEGVKLIAKHGKVIVPATLQDRIVDNYHELLQHPGKTRMEATMRHVFDWRGLREK